MLHRRRPRRRRRRRGAGARPGPRRGLQPGRDQLGGPVLGRSPTSPPGQRAGRGRADGVAPWRQEQRGAPSACRPPAPRSSASRRPRPRTRTRRVRPVNPYGAAKAYAHLLSASTASATCTRSARSSTTTSRPRPDQFVTRKITSTVAAIAQGRADASCSATSTPAATGAGRPTTSTRWSRGAPRAGRPGDYVIATGVATPVRDFVAAAFRRGRDRRLVPPGHVDPAFVRPADAAELTGDASRARARARLGADRRLRRDRRPDGRRRPVGPTSLRLGG